MLAKLKIHPRESLPNAAAIHRAEASFAESIGELRNQVGLLLANFRVALDAQDPTAIESHRNELNAFLDELAKAPSALN